MEDLYEYFLLFARQEDMCEKYEYQMRLMGTCDLSYQLLLSGDSRRFDGYEDFLEYCHRDQFGELG